MSQDIVDLFEQRLAEWEECHRRKVQTEADRVVELISAQCSGFREKYSLYYSSRFFELEIRMRRRALQYAETITVPHVATLAQQQLLAQTEMREFWNVIASADPTVSVGRVLLLYKAVVDAEVANEYVSKQEFATRLADFHESMEFVQALLQSGLTTEAQQAAFDEVKQLEELLANA